MASIIVPGLEESVRSELARQAAEHGRPLEAEVRDILTRAARRPHIGLALMRAAQDVGEVDALSVPKRSDIARRSDW